MTDAAGRPGPRPPADRRRAGGRFERVLAGVLAALAVVAALAGSSWWVPLAVGALAVLAVAVVQPVLAGRLAARRRAERGR